jgi:hypothetical protein
MQIMRIQNRQVAKADGNHCLPTQPLAIQVYNYGPNRERDISQVAILGQDFSCIRQSLGCPTSTLEWSTQPVFYLANGVLHNFSVCCSRHLTGKGVAQNPLRSRGAPPWSLVSSNRKRQSSRVTKRSYWLLSFTFHSIMASPDISFAR